MGVAVAPFDYAAAPKVDVPTCPVCEQPSASPVPAADRFGFRVGVSACRCGLTYLNPRLTVEAYADFYQTHYRALLRTLPCFQGPNARKLHDGKWRVARGDAIAALLRYWRPDVTVTHLLDVGGSDGQVAEGFVARQPAANVTILDPNADELAAAAARGFQTWPASIEQAAPVEGRYDGLICAQTADHWCEPLVALRWLRQALAPGGWLYLDLVDASVPRRSAEPPWKVDHPLYWTRRAMRLALATTGWRVGLSWATVDQTRVAYLCEGV